MPCLFPNLISQSLKRKQNLVGAGEPAVRADNRHAMISARDLHSPGHAIRKCHINIGRIAICDLHQSNHARPDEVSPQQITGYLFIRQHIAPSLDLMES